MYSIKTFALCSSYDSNNSNCWPKKLIYSSHVYNEYADNAKCLRWLTELSNDDYECKVCKTTCHS